MEFIFVFGFAVFIFASVFARMPPRDDCLFAKRTCGRKEPRTCPPGSLCINGRCTCHGIIKPPKIACPKYKIQIPGVLCEDLSRSPVARAPMSTCPMDATCYKGICCRPIFQSKCPTGRKPVPGRCDMPFSSVSKLIIPRCPKGAECFNGACCQSRITIKRCPKWQIKVSGSCKSCPIGSTCYTGVRKERNPNGICCRPLIGILPRKCPKIIPFPDKLRACPIYKKSPDQCKTDIDCLRRGRRPRGRRLCCADRCGRKYCYSPEVRPPFWERD